MAKLTDLPAEILSMIFEHIYEPRKPHTCPNRNRTFYSIRKVNKYLRNVTAYVFFNAAGENDKILESFGEGYRLALEERYAVLNERDALWKIERYGNADIHKAKDPWIAYNFAIRCSRTYQGYRRGLEHIYSREQTEPDVVGGAKAVSTPQSNGQRGYLAEGIVGKVKPCDDFATSNQTCPWAAPSLVMLKAS